ncbi:polycystic kidney disease protein 1-like 3 isoform X2 [Mercenaria mercenaria]|nr:polycystic kidney disease protein 1-like 3 isoform X2 [Mercenaria mercenaria]
MGYLVVACGEEVGNYSEGNCRTVRDDVTNLAGITTMIWELRKCDEVLSSYKATSREEYILDASSAVGEIYGDNSYLQVDTTVIFQVKCESDAYVLLQEDVTDKDKNIVEVTIGFGGNKHKSVLTKERNSLGNSPLSEHIETNILSNAEFHYFWISFAENEVRVGKGHILYVDQFLEYDNLNHDINYLSFGNGDGVSGSWKFDIDLCHLPLDQGSCSQSYWGYSHLSSSCVDTCGNGKNCFQTKALCEQSCQVSTTAANCNELWHAANGGLPNGTYNVTNANGEDFTVYCQFYSGYGYTFVSKNTEVDVNVTYLLDEREHVVIRHKRSDGSQYTAEMEQLSRLSDTPLLIQFNGQTGYSTPINQAMGPYIYIGFIPASDVYTEAEEGWKCNGQEITFTNCDGNPNSYIAFFFNKENASYTSNQGGYSSIIFCWYELATQVSSNEYLPDEFFTPYFEIHHGGCGGFGRGDTEPDIIGATVGVKFVTVCATPSDITNGTMSYNGTSVGSTVTYSCDSGLVMTRGDATRTCNDTGGWSGLLPVCGDFSIGIRCTKNCLEKKSPQSQLKFEVDCDACTGESVPSYSWSADECNAVDIQTCNGPNLKTANKKEFKLPKGKVNPKMIVKVQVIVQLNNGNEANASKLIEYSPIPVAGDCFVEPVSGYTLLTDFNITCINFTVEGNYSLTYIMKSKTINEWSKGPKFEMGQRRTAIVKLRVGDPDMEHRLFIMVRGKLVESGAFANISKIVQVLPADQAPEGSNVIAVARSMLLVTNNSQPSPIDEMIAAGNQAEAVQNLNVISSALTPANASVVNDTEREEKTKIRTTVVESLGKVNVSSFDTVSSVAQTLTEVTKVKTELSESTQNLAADLFDNLADSLEHYSDETSMSDIVDSAGDIFTGVTQLLDIKVDEGSKQLLQDKSDITDSTQDDAKLENVKNSTGKLLNTISKISTTLLSGHKSGDPPIVIQTESMSVQVEKVEKSALFGHNLSVGAGNETDVATLEFPSVLDGLDGDITDLGLQVLHMKKNPYVWDKTAAEVNMEVLSVELTSDTTEVTVTNLTQPVKVTLKAPETEKPPYSTLQLHIIKSGSNLTYNLSMTNILNSNFTIPEGKTTILSLFSFFQIRHFKIYIDEYEKPTFDKVKELGVSYPDQADELSKNFSKFELTNERAENSSLIFFTYNKSMSANYTGTYFLAVGLDLQNNSTIEDLQDLDTECIGNDTLTDCETVVEVTLQIDTTTLACTYWDESSQAWSNQGCEVSPLSTKEKLECLCTHLTAFSGGVFVLPNFVDPIGDAALFLTFFDNPVVVTTVVIVWVLYFFLIHWARQSDRRDQEQVGVIAVDVDAVNKYMYLVCVVTGWWTDAGTTANVFFYMKGMNGSSARIKLTTSAKLCFQTGYEDWFLVTTEESLGDLKNVILWHDNSGTNPHWYLSQIFVKDLQEKKSWTFIYNDWLAVDRGSSLLTKASVSAISKEELKFKQKHNFMVKTTQDLRDSHLWISIFSKPARSTFTRVQRVTCALSLLLTTMLTNIMFYGIPTDDPDDQVGGSRGVVISLSSIVIGIQSSLIMFPVNVIIMQMFLKLKQRPEKEEIDKKSQSYIQSLYDRVSHITTDVLLNLASGVPPPACKEEQNSQSDCSFATVDETVKVNLSTDSNGASHQVTPFESATSNVLISGTHSSGKYNIASPKPESSRVTVLSKSKQTGKILPWWFLYISWFLVLSVSLICSYFVMLYGLKYGYQRSVEWLVSFLTGFSQSALITQPLKVLAVAIIITLIFKRTVEFEDYGPEVRLDEDTMFVNSVNKTEEAHIPFSQPLSVNLLQKIKERVQLEWLMNITLRDIGLYIIYVAVVCIVVHGHRDIKEAYYNSLAIEDVLVNPGCIILYQCFFLANAENMQNFYRYMYEVAIPNLADMSIADHEYATPGSSHFLVGPWRLRQLRIDRGTCGKGADDLYRQFNMNVKECSGPYWLGDEEKRNFRNSWSEVLAEASDPPTRWTYQSAWKLKTIPFKGKLATYSGGGYIITMPSNSSLHEGIIKDMWNSDWIDERTRAIFLEFTLYNPNADLFSVVIILFEFSNNGVIVPYHQIFSTRLYHYSTGFANFVLFCECLFLIFNISFTYIEWKKFGVLGRKKYFEDYWSYIEIIQIALAFSVVGLFFQRLVSVNGVMKDFRASDGSTFISFYTAVSWDFILGYVMAFLVALVTLKAIKLLKFNKRTYMVADTISHSKSSIASFMFLALLVTIAFGHFATMAFGRMMDDYRDMMTSLITIFNFALGISDFPGLQETNRILGPVYFCIFVFVITFIFLTVFVAILNFGISESKALFEKRQNKFELLEYVVTKLKLVLNVEN